MTRKAVMQTLAAAIAAILATATTTAAAPRQKDTPATVPSLVVGTPAPDQRTVDSRTGIVIVTRRVPGGDVVTSVTDGGVSVQKRVGARATTAVVTSPAGTVTVVNEGKDLTIRHGATMFRASRATDREVALEHAFLRQSPVLTAGTALLARLDLKPDTYAKSALLVTRTLLASLQGDKGAVAAYRASVRMAAAAPRTVRVGEGQGPKWCWDTYARDVNSYVDDVEDCMRNLSALAIILGGQDACTLEYIMKCDLALTWLIACSGGLPVK